MLKSIKWCLLLFLVFFSYSAKSQSVFTFCKSISDDVYPVETVTEISAGEPVYFHLQCEIPIGTAGGNNITMGWIIHTIGEDGTDYGFVNEYFTYFEPGNRRFCTSDPMYFDKPGKYRVYAINWDDRQLNHHTGNLTKFYAKNEIIVK